MTTSNDAAVKLATELWFDCPLDVIDHYVKPFVLAPRFVKYIVHPDAIRVFRCGHYMIEHCNENLFITDIFTGDTERVTERVTERATERVTRDPASVIEQLVKYIPASVLAEGGTYIYESSVVYVNGHRWHDEARIINRSLRCGYKAWVRYDHVMCCEYWWHGSTETTLFDVPSSGIGVSNVVDPMFVVGAATYIVPCD